MSVGTLDWLFVVQEVEAPASGGYLIIGDDTVISHCMIKDFNKSMVSWWLLSTQLYFAVLSSAIW